MAATSVQAREVHDRLTRGEAVRIVDVRMPGEYRAKHIEPSLLVPLEQLDAQALRSENGKTTYVLCRTGRRAATAQQRLTEAGLSDVHVIEGGIEAWEREQLPVIRGQGAISIERQVRIAAGSLVLLGLLLAWLVHPAFAAISAFVGGGLVFAGITDRCGMGMLLAKLPWNR